MKDVWFHPILIYALDLNNNNGELMIYLIIPRSSLFRGFTLIKVHLANLLLLLKLRNVVLS